MSEFVGTLKDIDDAMRRRRVADLAMLYMADVDPNDEGAVAAFSQQVQNYERKINSGDTGTAVDLAFTAERSDHV